MQKYKGKIVGEVYTKLGQSDYAAELANLRAAKPDAVFFFLPGLLLIYLAPPIINFLQYRINLFQFKINYIIH